MKPPARFDISVGNLDSALRYERVIRLLAPQYRTDSVILEVGSGSGGITEFLRHKVIGLDAAFSRTDDRYTGLVIRVQGTATSLPFQNESCDIVVSVDMLEHLSIADRPKCLREMLRVQKKGGRCIVAFPADRSAERLDRRLNDAHLKHRGDDHPWVIEHLRTGLPRAKEVVALLRRERLDLRIKHYKHLWSPAWWYGVHKFPTIGQLKVPFFWRILTPEGARVSFSILKHLNFRPAYRSILVIDKPG